jgi:hypothetical protein
MAKKKNSRLTVTNANHASKTMQLPIKGGDGLPDYQRFFTSNEYRWFFEPPECKSEVIKGVCNICSTDRAFRIVSDGKALVSLEIAQTFSRLLVQYLMNNKPKRPGDYNSCANHLFNYLSTLEKTLNTFEDITFDIYVGYIQDRPNTDQSKMAKSFLLSLLPLHPHSKFFNISSIYLSNSNKTKIQELDFDSLLDEKDYSDRVLMQMLAYCFYELDVWKKRWELMQSTTKESLGEYYFDKYSIDDPLLAKVLSNGNDGHDILFLNLLLEIKEKRAGHIRSPSNMQIDRIHKVTHAKNYKGEDGHDDYLAYTEYLAEKMWRYYTKSTKTAFRPYLRFETQHLPSILALYMMISTGKNQETITSIKRNYGGRPWYENFDINLGVDDATPAAQQIIRVVGTKTRGIASTKEIPMRIPINWPIFDYMKLYDDIVNDPTRKYFFNFRSSTLRQKYKKFCESYEIVDDNNKLLTSIKTSRLRKTFAGHLLMELVDDCEDGEDLVSKMREALNHQEFDTTLLSYIMKTGTGNQVINAGIVALTTNMLEKAMVFQGTICEDTNRNPENKEVYLCDCTDDMNPSHGIPIADRCRKYDMCLGCERAEVYAVHILRICYRIMQYDEIASQNKMAFSGLLEDRRQIALDTVNKFRDEHGRGLEIVEHSYFEAVKAMKDGTPLLPAIIQF